MAVFILFGKYHNSTMDNKFQIEYLIQYLLKNHFSTNTTIPCKKFKLSILSNIHSKIILFSKYYNTVQHKFQVEYFMQYPLTI